MIEVESKNHRLNQILQTLTRYLIQPPTTPTADLRSGVPPLGVSPATAFGSGTQASNSKSTACPVGCVTSKVRSRVTMEEIEPAPKRRPAPVARAPASHMWTLKDKESRGSPRIQEIHRSLERVLGHMYLVFSIWDTNILSAYLVLRDS